MRILMFTQWFDPEPTFKGVAFARALERSGHEVRVITGFPNYPGGKVYPGYRIRPWKHEVIEGIPRPIKLGVEAIGDALSNIQRRNLIDQLSNQFLGGVRNSVADGKERERIRQATYHVARRINRGSDVDP